MVLWWYWVFGVVFGRFFGCIGVVYWSGIGAVFNGMFRFFAVLNGMCSVLCGVGSCVFVRFCTTFFKTYNIGVARLKNS